MYLGGMKTSDLHDEDYMEAPSIGAAARIIPQGVGRKKDAQY